MALNKVVLMGRFSADPELRYSSNQTEIVNFTLAVDKPYNKNNDHPEANWIECVAFGKTAQLINDRFGKGSRIIVEGRLDTSNFTDKDGNKRKSIKVVVENINFVDKKSDSHNNSDDSSSNPDGFTAISESIDDDDLPF